MAIRESSDLLRPSLIGAGGHAKVVYSALEVAVRNRIEIRADSTGTLQSFRGQRIHHPAVLGDMRDRTVHVAIGDNMVRLAISNAAVAAGASLFNVISRTAAIDESADLATGCFIASGAIVAADAKIGSVAIVNHGAIVDHDATVGLGAHVAPGAVIGGGVELGSAVLLGAGATVLPSIRIGAGAVIGAGSIVTKHVPDGAKWIGTRLIDFAE